jgi:hypothetical protein
MSPEWLTAIGTLGTLVVIAASAIAALIQLRHMRGSNQIIALNEAHERLESAEFVAARHFIEEDLPARLADPEVRRNLASSALMPDGFEGIRVVANFFEKIGGFVRAGILDEDLACHMFSGIVIRSWGRLSPIVTNRRAVRGMKLWDNFEYFASISKQFMAQHPHGDYPQGIARMPSAELWPETREILARNVR